jgi:hypothetical protein
VGNNVRTVTLELLRHGPPHNQLLSPLTEYLALCGNHSAATVTMPFEHAQLLNRLRALMYKATPEDRKFQLKDTAQVMGEVLGRVPGLIAELAETPGQDNSLTQLRLILSASELALLPFELANAPNGFPGAGQSLALQAQAPLCITREVRRVSNTRFQWPIEPKVLFAAASPPGVGPIPLEQHLLALRTVIDPWVEHGLPGGARRDEAAKLKARLDPHLVVLPQATVGAIQRACAERNFTHVHILAHGVPLEGEEEKRYGLALHSDRNPDGKDIVDGARLATLLRTYRRGNDNVLSGPAVVTVASCDSGNVGSVVESAVGAGASIAHALHEGGIPLVVAAQFPLSFAASILMTQVFYEGLLWGADPRTLLNDVRWQLKSKLPDSHDWASLVAYAALPADLEQQLARVRLKQAHRSINAALKYMDRVTERVWVRHEAPRSNKPLPKEAQEREKLMERARTKLSDAEDRLNDLLLHTPAGGDRSLIYGLLASTRKRDAKILFNAARGSGDPHARFNADKAASESLRQAREYYAKAFKADRTSSWALVQEMSVAAVLDGADAIVPDTWTLARVLAEDDLYADDRSRAIDAYASLTELHLLHLLTLKDSKAMAAATRTAKDYAARLCKLAPDSINVYSTRRQLERYVDWFSQYENGLDKLRDAAAEIVDMLPFNKEKFS